MMGERSSEGIGGQGAGEPVAIRYDCSAPNHHYDGDGDRHGGEYSMSEAAAAIDDGRGVVDWSSLNDHLLMQIFGLLTTVDRCRLCCVCKTWRHVAMDPSFWCMEGNLYSLSVSKPHATEQAVKAVVLRSRGTLVNLFFQSCKRSLLEFIGRNCPMLEGFIVGDVKFFTLHGGEREWMPAVSAFVHGCGDRLRSLKILFQVTEIHVKVPRRRGEISEVVKALVTGLPKLVCLVLHITGADRLTDRDVRVITQNLPRLEVLKLTGARITNASLDLIGTRLDNLRSLHVDSCSKLTREAVDSLRSNWENLQVSANGIFR
ncbi:hypothetical protein CBR_g27974 [Chara braunii]|uniref:F-box domain-containing protein n=1 Tax=Chara braunii TaxID=69332 RepID=A0A388L8V5_CHABU|nr:hypothetical protein CBR_g27974 [Chara braunii]|eukprot:GBG78750.1 hypothetical protein CBR_g27974 [Chara braunii]